jgi:hypothetical protein
MCQGREDTVVSTQHASYWLERAHDRAPAIRTPLYLSVLNSFCIVVCVVLKRGDDQPGSTFGAHVCSSCVSTMSQTEQ